MIDIQPRWFSQARNKTLQKNIVKRLGQHRAANQPAILLEYEEHDRTVPTIRRWFADEEVFIKPQDNGAASVAEAVRDLKLGRHRHFIVCGVNTCCCVLGTARGILTLSRKFRVTLPVYCCRTPCDDKDHYVSDVLIRNFVLEDPKRRKHVWH